MKYQTLPFLLGFLLACSVQAGDIRAANMRVEQLSMQTVKVTINIYTHIHAEAVPLRLCWGDGICEDWITVAVEEWPLLDSRQYRLEAFHGYTAAGPVTISATACCWTGDLGNFSSSPNIPFKIETDFTVVVGLPGQYNSTPQVEPFYAICSSSACHHFPQVQDVEGDELVWELCEPDIEGYKPLEEVFPGPNNQVIFDADQGSLSWISPPFQGLFGHVSCLTEMRNGEVISRSQFFTLLVVNNALPVKEKERLDPIRLFPNPVSEVLYLQIEEEGSSQITISIYDALGRKVVEQEGLNAIEVADWPEGMYRLVLEDNRRKFTTRFFKIMP